LSFKKNHPRYLHLISIYGEPQEQNKQQQEFKTLSEEIIEISLYNTLDGFEVSKKVPLQLTVEGLKLLCNRAFNLDPSFITLYFKHGGNQELPEFLIDNFQNLDYYGIKNGTKIFINRSD